MSKLGSRQKNGERGRKPGAGSSGEAAPLERFSPGSRRPSDRVEDSATPSEPQAASRLVLTVGEGSLHQAARRHLASVGLRVAAAGDSPAAAVLLRELEPELVLLDLEPGAEGDLASLATFGQTPAVVVTGRSDDDWLAGLFEAGAAEVAIKPVNWTLLGRRLQRLIESQRTARELARVRQELERIEVAGLVDATTGLPNRALLSEMLQRALAASRRSGGMVAVLYLDIDRFKELNGTLGHRAGNQILKQLGGRLEDCFRASDFVGTSERGIALARTGDEFIVALTEVPGVELAARAAARVLEMLSTPFDLQGREVFISVSIGIAVYPLDASDADGLIQRAETAMYHAKSQGGGAFQYFSDWMNEAAREAFELLSRLRQAVVAESFCLHYQPLLDTRSGEILGLEALVRWRHPELGTVFPADFIGVAEESGLVGAIGDWVLRTACQDLKRWSRGRSRPLRLSINVSPRQLTDGRFLNFVKEVLAETGVDPATLRIELTELAVVESDEPALKLLKEFKRLGLQLAVDDFGVGHATLSYLKKFPLDVLKIDRSFVRGIGSELDDDSIAAAVIAMAHRLGLTVVAEGVENEAQLAFLKQQGCDEVQGYLLARPLTAAEVTQLLASADAGGAPGARS